MAYSPLGKYAILADNTGNFGAPAWRAIKSFKDIMLNQEPQGIVDATDRFVDYVLELPTRYKIGVTASAIWNKNTTLTAIRTAFLAGSVKEFAVLDRPAADGGAGGGLGIRGEMLVKKMTFSYPLNGPQMLDIELVGHGIHTASQNIQFYTDATAAAGTADAAGTKRLGKVASINTAAGAAITRTGDLKVSLEWVTGDFSDRTHDYAVEGPTQMRITAEAELFWQPGTANVLAFRTAFLANSDIDLSILDDAYSTSGAWGPDMDWRVKSFNHRFPLTERQSISVVLTPSANGTTLPSFLTI